MSAYTVVFEMPASIAGGIATGVFEVVGGVVRRVDGKQVVMWLRPAFEEGSKVAVAVGPKLPLLVSGAALATIASAATLVVTVAGFVVLSQQVSRVESRLDQALSKLDAIIAVTGWLKQTTYLTHKAKLGAALHVADTMEATGKFDSLAVPLGDFYAAQAFYSQQMADILSNPCPLALAPAFVEFANLYVLATGAKARALTLLRGEAEAARQAAPDSAAYAGLRAGFMAALDDPERHLGQLVALTDEAEDAMKEAMPFLPPVAAAEYMPLPGLGPDVAILAEMREASIARLGEPAGAVLVAELAHA